MTEQKNKKDKWIEEILSSAEGITRAEASPFMFSKILSRLKSVKNSTVILPFRKLALGFLTLILLVVLNVTVLFRSTNVNVTNTTVSDKNNKEEIIPSQTNPYLEILT